jgi:hypothetical protein
MRSRHLVRPFRCYTILVRSAAMKLAGKAVCQSVSLPPGWRSRSVAWPGSKAERELHVLGTDRNGIDAKKIENSSSRFDLADRFRNEQNPEAWQPVTAKAFSAVLILGSPTPRAESVKCIRIKLFRWNDCSKVEASCGFCGLGDQSARYWAFSSKLGRRNRYMLASRKCPLSISR